MSVYLRFSFDILVRIYTVKTPFSQNFPAARADRPCAYFFEIFTFRKSRCAFISFQKSPESGSVRLLRGGAFIYNTPVELQCIALCILKVGVQKSSTAFNDQI